MASINVCFNYIENYLSWLKDKFIIECNNKSCHIITPFLREDNDNIEVFIEQKDNKLILTDDGTTFEYLFLRGIDLTNSKKYRYLNSITNKTETIFEDFEIKSYVKYDEDFGIKFNNFINSIISISNLTYTAIERDKHTFRDDLRIFLDYRNINYTNIEMLGYSRQHRLDFVVIKKEPVIIEPISAKSSSYGLNLAERIAFQWNDLKRNKNKFIGVSLINDKEDIWTSDITNVLTKNSDATISWSNRDKLIDLVA